MYNNEIELESEKEECKELEYFYTQSCKIYDKYIRRGAKLKVKWQLW